MLVQFCFDSDILVGKFRSYISDLQCGLSYESLHSGAIVACSVRINPSDHAARKLHRTAIVSINAILMLIGRKAIDVDKQKGDGY